LSRAIQLEFLYLLPQVIAMEQSDCGNLQLQCSHYEIATLRSQ